MDNKNNQIENNSISNFPGNNNQNSSNQKLFWIGGIVVLVILAIVGGSFYFYSSKKVAQNQVNQSQNIQKTDNQKLNQGIKNQNQVKQSNNLSATADWKIYHNEEFGFEFKYPEKWYIYNEQSKIFIQPDKEEKGNIPGPHAQALELSISATYDKALSQIVEERKAKNTSIKYKQSEGTIGGQKAIQLISICEGVGCGAPEWFVIKDGFLYHFNSNLGPSYIFALIISTFKFTDQQETVIEHPECSPENPPKVYFSKSGEVLDLCGNKTNYLAHEFEKENVIIFQTDKWNEEKQKHFYSIKIITTTYPYQERMLISNSGDSSFIFFTPLYFYPKDNLYFWGSSGGGPGSYNDIFIFSPSMEKFLLIKDNIWDGKHSINIISSNLKQRFSIERKFRQEPIQNSVPLQDNDIEVVINDKPFTKKEVDEGKVGSEMSVFDCNILPLLTPVSKFIIAKYANYFPTKIPCFKNSVSNPDIENQIVGYFDIENRKLIVTEDGNEN